MNPITPIGDRLLVRTAPRSETRESGLFVAAQPDGPRYAEVLAVGQLDPERENLVTEGDAVLIPQYGGIQLFPDDEELLLISYGEVLARYEPVVTSELEVKRKARAKK